MAKRHQQNLFTLRELATEPHIVNSNYETVSDANFHDVKHRIKEAEIMAFDIETTGLSVFDKVVGFSVSLEAGQGFYFPYRHLRGKNLSEEQVLKMLGILKKKELVYHNAKFDWGFILSDFGVNLPISEDTLIMAGLIDFVPRGLSLSALALKHFDIKMIEFKEVAGNTTFDKVSIDDATVYACEDTDLTIRLYEKFHPSIKAKELKTVYKIEKACIKAVSTMERNGVKLDKVYFDAKEAELKKLIDKLEKKIAEYHRFDLNSPKQMLNFIVNVLGLDTKATGIEDLKRLRKKHEAIELIIEHRSLYKLWSSFVAKLPTALAEDQKLHSSFNQMGAVSGRFSSSGGVGLGGERIKINLQQLPKAKVANVRHGFIPSDGCYWIKADYSQIEYRLAAVISGEHVLMDAYEKGIDYHTNTASIMLNKPIDKVTKEDRAQGKTLNFGLNYGMHYKTLAKRLGIQDSAAEALMKNYFANIPNLKKKTDAVKKYVVKHHQVSTHFGRIRKFKIDWSDDKAVAKAKREAWNTVIQGTAADIMKVALARVNKKMRKKYKGKANIIMTVHDELDFEVSKDIPLGEFANFIYETMDLTFKSLPGMVFKIDVEAGTSFGVLADVPRGMDNSITFNEFMEMQELEEEGETQQEEEERKVEPEEKIIGLDTTTLDDIKYPFVVFQVKEEEHLKLIKTHLESTYGNYNVYIYDHRTKQLYALPNTYMYNPTVSNRKSIERFVGVKVVVDEFEF